MAKQPAKTTTKKKAPKASESTTSKIPSIKAKLELLIIELNEEAVRQVSEGNNGRRCKVVANELRLSLKRLSRI